jgi:hypothetical protein
MINLATVDDAAPVIPAAWELAPRICASAPYLSVTNPRSPRPGSFTGSLVAEHPMEDEAGPIAAAEAGRHLALAGALAAASLFPDTGRRFYLARTGRLDRGPGAELPATGEPLIAHAEAVLAGARLARIAARLETESGLVTHTLELEHQLLAVGVFERIFASQRRVTVPVTASPYRREMPLDFREVDATGALARMTISPADCAGHFDGFPAVPVAVLMHALSRVAGRAFRSPGGGCTGRYWVDRADIGADRLAFADEELSLQARRLADDGGRARFDCAAWRGQERVGSMALWLAPAR